MHPSGVTAQDGELPQTTGSWVALAAYATALVTITGVVTWRRTHPSTWPSASSAVWPRAVTAAPRRQSSYAQSNRCACAATQSVSRSYTATCDST